MKTCYTYYEEIEHINRCPSRKYEQKDIIDICRISWKKYGWDLVVLDRSIAEQHPFFSEYSNIVSELPTVNLQQYEYSCFIRWLAIAQIGGGLMIDYDVINMGCRHLEYNNSKITIYQGHVPCVVYGTSEQYLDICKKFCELKNECIHQYFNKPHTSDMIMLSSKKIDFYKMNIVVDYPKIGPLVHCSQQHCSENLKSKFDAMKELVIL